MKAFQFALMAGAAAIVFAAGAAEAANEKKTTRLSDGSYKVVTYENGKKVTTVYKPQGTRKVGLVGGKPYPVHRSGELNREGTYYTQDGLPYFHPTRTLGVQPTGKFNK